MPSPLSILVIAPSAPPRNSPEALQVRRILAALDPRARGTLVTIAPDAAGWSATNPALALPLSNFTTHTLALPLHRFTQRLLASHRSAWLHQPDSFFWIRFFAARITRMLSQKPDIIYSRSSPMSAALLALRLKQRLQIPWVMHLSDPWADNPYHSPTARSMADEAACFAAADHITLTTRTQAEFYQHKYPEHAHKITVTPNVMAEDALPPPATPKPANAPLHLVYAGNLYGNRSLEPLIRAIDALRSTHPTLVSQLHIDVYGNAQEPCLSWLRKAPDVLHYHGHVAFEQAYAAQQNADYVISVEPVMHHPLGHSFLPSKVVDSLALHKPLFALTPADSETASLCAEGYGIAISPDSPDAIAAALARCIEQRNTLRHAPPKAPPSRYLAFEVVDALLLTMNRLCAEQRQ